MASSSLPHLTEKGLWAISIGHYSLGGKRIQKKHWLGRDEESANRLAKALHVAWECETSTDPDGKKIWSQASIDRAFDMVGLGRKEAPAKEVKAHPAPAYPVQPKPKSSSVTLSQALDEYAKWVKSREDVSASHKKVSGDRVKSLKVHLDDAKHNGTPLSDIAVAAIDGECLDIIRNMILARPLVRRKQATPTSCRLPRRRTGS